MMRSVLSLKKGSSCACAACMSATRAPSKTNPERHPPIANLSITKSTSTSLFYFVAVSCSRHQHASSVHRDRLAGHIGGVGARHESGKAGHVIGIADAAERNLFSSALGELFRRGVFQRLGGHRDA